MIASQAVRLASASPARRRTTHPQRATRVRAHAMARPRIASASWDLRVFAVALGAIVFVFALALFYVGETTALSVASYDVQKLQATRAEIARQSSLLEVQSARLDSPARIAAAAARLGMVHARYVPVIPADPLAAKR